MDEARLANLPQELSDLAKAIIRLLQESGSNIPMSTAAQMAALLAALEISRRMAPDTFPDSMERVRLGLVECIAEFKDMMRSNPELYVDEEPAGPAPVN